MSQQQQSIYKAFVARLSDPQQAQSNLKKEFQTLLAEEGQLWTNQRNFKTSYKFQHLNRYSNILALDSTIFPSYCTEDPKFYFNANFLDAQTQFPGFPFDFVAHQAPTEECFGAFWDSVLKSKAMGIVMLTGLTEGSRRKADLYWPNKKGESMKFGERYDDLIVTNLGNDDETVASSSSGIIKTVFSIKNNKTQNEDFRTVLFRYNDWPDHGVPSTTLSVEHLIEEVEKRAQPFLQEQGSCGKTSSPLYVHCSAGVGRTGSFISSIVGKFLFKNTVTFNPTSTIFEMVRWLKHRRVGSVQQSEQYFFIHRMMVAEMENVLKSETHSSKK